MSTGTVLDALVEALRRSGRYNHDDKEQPVAVLWIDPAELWEPLIPELRQKLPLLTLGDYAPEVYRGPGIWLRWQLCKAAAGDTEPRILYLPGVERDDLRAIESCSPELRSIAELQFRSAWWLQSNQAPWTPAAFLRSVDGLGVDLARDDETRAAVQSALPELAQVAREDLRRRITVDASYLNGLLISDEIKTLLDWLNEPAVARQNVADNVWAAFVAQARRTFGIDLEAAGPVSVAGALGSRKGSWQRVWQRFAEAPHSYPGIPAQLRKARPGTLFEQYSDSWPQDNEDAEGEVRSALTAVGDLDAVKATERVLVLEAQHGARRTSVWGQLGEAPLAMALAPLADLGKLTASYPTAGSIPDFVTWYADMGWRVDAAAVAALRAASDPSSRDAVGRAVRAIYLPWVDESARRFQDLVTSVGSIGQAGLDVRDGDCVIFVDGLRLDVGELLRAELAARGATTEMRPRLAPFPTMTSTGKPAVAPLSSRLTGGTDFGVTADDKPVDAPRLRSLMARDGVTAFGDSEVGDPSGRGWTEAGDLDATGHKLGLKLVDHITSEVSEVASRARELLHAGWKRVHIVTDHGWLLMPDCLPKVHLDEHLTMSRKARCARLRDSAADIAQPTLKWTWNPQVRVVSGRGVAAFEAGHIYAHGGLSPQESVIPHLVATLSGAPAAAAIEQLKWQGMRCRVDVVNAPVGSTIDVRRQPGRGDSSIIAGPSAVEGDDDVKVLIQDPDSTGEPIFVVLLSCQGEVLAQLETRVGGAD